MSTTPKKKYYKVVKNYGKLYSCRAGKQEYPVKKWTHAPDNTRLFVFDNLHDAINFSVPSEQIWECSIRGGIKCAGAYFPSGTDLFWKRFNEYLKTKKNTKDIQKYVENGKCGEKVRLAEYPAILTKSVFLTKQIA